MKQTLSKTLRLNFTYLYILHSRYHLKIKGDILKNKSKDRRVFTNEIARLIIMKMKKKIKNRLHRYDKNRPKSRHEIWKVSQYDDAYKY